MIKKEKFYLFVIIIYHLSHFIQLLKNRNILQEKLFTEYKKYYFFYFQCFYYFKR